MRDSSVKLNNNQQAFFALVRGGLWEQVVSLSSFGEIDYSEVYRLAEEQSVMGLVAAGLEHLTDVKLPKEEALQFVGQTLQLEQQNKAMNLFVSDLIEKMRKEDIYTLLVKGQGIAQCYERPLWRACGDVDLFLSDDNYKKANSFLSSISSRVEKEDSYEKHIGMLIGSWMVELHGNLNAGISSHMDKVIAEAQRDVFYGGNVRSWQNGNTQVFLPGIDDDVVFIFTHILKHFYKGGIGLRQICDWCRLLYKNKGKINIVLLENRLRRMGIVAEWKSFAALAVHSLGMEIQYMPFYSEEVRWRKKADKILLIVLENGNMGHNKDLTYQQSYSPVKRKLVTFGILTKDAFRNFTIFPLNTMRSWRKMLIMGINNAL